eukprot:2457972-Pyramimonas_sp.AAC.1
MGIREPLAKFETECARHNGENHILKTSRPQSVNLLQCLKQMCAAQAPEPHVGNDQPSICETVPNFEASES